MSDGRCASCTWWDAWDGTAGDERKWGDCELAASFRNEPDHTEALLMATSAGAGEIASLRTRAEFGCVQHQPRSGA